MVQSCFLDTETTGLGDDAQLVEIAITDSDGMVLFESFCKPTVLVEAGAAAIHGISNEQLIGAPTWPDIVNQVQQVLMGKTVVIFNVDFDIRILNQTSQAYGLCSKWIGELVTDCAMMRAAARYGATNKYGISH